MNRSIPVQHVGADNFPFRVGRMESALTGFSHSGHPVP